MTSPVLRLMTMARPAIPRLLVATLAGAGAAASGIGLMIASAWLIDRAALHPPVLYLMVAIVTVRAFGLFRGVLRYVERLAGHDAALRVLTRVRTRGYTRLERLAPAGLLRMRSGDLVTRLVSDMDAATDLLTRAILPYTVAALVGLATVGFIATLLPAAAAVLLAGLIVVGLGAPAIQTAVSRRADRRAAPLRGELGAQIVELLHGAPDLLAYGAAAPRLAALARTDNRLRKATARASTSVGLASALVAFTGGTCVWVALALGTSAVRAGTLDGVWLAAIALTAIALFEAVGSLPAAAAQLGTARTSLRRVFAILDRPAPVADPQTPLPMPVPPYHLRLEKVTARWPGSAVDAVTGIDLDLPAGRRVALVGPSGSGKTTIAALLVRFLDPAGGRVTCNGTDLRDLALEDLRRIVGVVAEDAHIFDTTITENLRIGLPAATLAQMRAALAQARLLDWVDGLPLGLATPVGERGTRLSGGQRRRLMLARALLADFPVLILDEPTEHLDVCNAAAITDDLLAATTGRTVLLITHRPYGLEAVDEIVHLGLPTAG